MLADYTLLLLMDCDQFGNLQQAEGSCSLNSPSTDDSSWNARFISAFSRSFIGSYLSPPQRLRSCCFDPKGILAVGLGKGKRQCRRPGERETAARYLKKSPKKASIGSLCGGERGHINV